MPSRPPVSALLNNGNDDEDPYAILRVDRMASEKEIRTAYLSLASCLHPDKMDMSSIEHLRMEASKLAEDAIPQENFTSLRALRLMADEHFQIIDRAFRILSDPLKRSAYDELGLPGVRAVEALSTATQTNALSLYGTPTQIKGIITRLLQEEKQRILEGNIGAHGCVTLEMSVLSPSDEYGVLYTKRSIPSARRIIIQQGVMFPVSDNVNMTFGGYVVTKGKSGSGNATASFRHVKSPNDWLAISTEVGFDPKTSISKGFSISNKNSGTFSFSVDNTGPSFQCGTHISYDLVTDADFSWGVSNHGSQGSVHIDRAMEKGRGLIRMELSGEKGLYPGIRATYVKHFTKRTKGDVGFKLGGRGIEMYVDVLRILTSLTSMKVGCRVGLQGITVMLRFQRGGMRFQCPILLSSSIDPIGLALGTIIPTFVDAIIRYLVQPTLRAAAAEVHQEIENKSRQLVRKFALRNAAANQIQLMLNSAIKKSTIEAGKGGLIILSARYGSDLHLDFGKQWYLKQCRDTEHTISYRNIDVTVPLQFFVSNGSVRLQSGSKSALLGFFNVTDGLSDKDTGLYVRYIHAGRVFEITVDDFEPLDLPSPKAFYIGPADVVR